jgi:hypothetical protein
MPTRIHFCASLLFLGLLPAVAMPLQAQEHVPFSDALPSAWEDEDDIELIDDWEDNTIVLVGTPGDDKITILVERRQIRFWVNDDSVGRIREHELPDLPSDEDTSSMLPDPTSLLHLIVSGAGGNDLISLSADPSAMDLFYRARFLLYGGDGLDIITSEGVPDVTLVGGMGIDNLLGDGFNSKYIGSELLVSEANLFEGSILPDGCKDHLFPSNYSSIAYRKHYLHFTPVVYTNPSFKTLDKNPPKLPGVPTIVSREKGDLVSPEPLTFAAILLEHDEVHSDVGCDVFDLNFREDGTMLPPTYVE